MVSEPTSRVLWGRGVGCLVKLEPISKALWGRVQAVQVVLGPTSRALWGRCAGCLSGVETYLQGTVGQLCRLFKWCWNLPPGHRGAGVQAV